MSRNTSKIVKFNLNAREDLLKGVNILTDSVKNNNGPERTKCSY